MDTDLDLLLKYPLISYHSDGNNKVYTGRVLSGNHDIDLYIIEENSHGNTDFKLKTSFGHEVDAKIANITSINICDFVDKIVNVLRQKVAPNFTNTYRKIINEYSEFTGFHLTIRKCIILPDLSKISLTTLDDGCREHSLEIVVDFNEPLEIFSPLNLCLPQEVVMKIPRKSAYLTEIYTKFLVGLEELQGVFDVMDDLDRNCCILDPQEPTRKDCYRRVWLDHNLSVMVIVDPLNVTRRPELKFLGPESVVDGHRQRLTLKLEDWNEHSDFLQSLLAILELESFPIKPKQDRVTLMDTGECRICFCSRLNDKLPEIVCDNRSCENFYHIECLYEWLMSINSKRIFNQLQGQCPNCEKTIACPVPEVFH